jgi:CheY-like chemotaxis protein
VTLLLFNGSNASNWNLPRCTNYHLTRRQYRAGSIFPDFDVICEAADGFEAVKTAEKLQPDVIVLDISMPGMNGLEAARRTARQPTGTRLSLGKDGLS